MALIKCQTFWLEQLDSDADFVTAFSFDFAKAFDSSGLPSRTVQKDTVV